MDIEEYLKGKKTTREGDLPLSGINSVGSRFGQTSNLDYEQYKDYINPIEFDPFDSGKMNKLRADRQGFVSELGIHLANTIPNIATGIVGDIGRLGTLATEWGKDRDYKNTLTEWADNNKNLFGEVYRKNPEKTIDITDSAFVLDNIFGLYESVSQFALEGIATAGVLNPLSTGIAKGLTMASNASKLANMVVKGVKVGEKVGKGLEGLAGMFAKNIPQTANSALLGYFESAAQAKDTYNMTYKSLIDKGIPEEVAKERAREATVKMVQINTAALTLLNFSQIESLMAPPSSLRELGEKGIFARKGASDEVFTDMLKGVKNNQAVKEYITGGGIKKLAKESFKEGFEEVVGVATPKMAMRSEINKKEGEDVNILDALKEVNKFGEDVFNQEGGLNFILGMLGGLGTEVILSRNPWKKHIDYDANGKPQSILDSQGKDTGKFKTIRMSEHAYGKKERERIVDEFTGTALTDIEKTVNLVKEIKDMSLDAKVTPEQIEDKRRELFNIKAYNSIVLGTGEHLAQDFKEIAEVDNTIDLGVGAKQAANLANQNTLAFRESLKGKQVTPEDQAKLTQMEDEAKKFSEEAIKLDGQTQASVMGFVSKNGTNIKGKNNPTADMSYKKRAENAIKFINEATVKYNQLSDKYGFGDYQEHQVAQGLYRSWLDTKQKQDTYQASKERVEREIKGIKSQLEREGLSKELVDISVKRAELEAAVNIKKLQDKHGDKWVTTEEIEAIQKIIDEKAKEITSYNETIDADMQPFVSATVALNEVGTKVNDVFETIDGLNSKLVEINRSTATSEEKFNQASLARQEVMAKLTDINTDVNSRPSKKARARAMVELNDKVKKLHRIVNSLNNKKTDELHTQNELDAERLKVEQELKLVEKQREEAVAEYEKYLADFTKESEKKAKKEKELDKAREIIDKNSEYKNAVIDEINDRGVLNATTKLDESLQTNEGIAKYMAEYRSKLDKVTQIKKATKDQVKKDKKVTENIKDLNKSKEITEEIKSNNITTEVASEVKSTTEVKSNKTEPVVNNTNKAVETLKKNLSNPKSLPKHSLEMINNTKLSKSEKDQVISALQDMYARIDAYEVKAGTNMQVFKDGLVDELVLQKIEESKVDSTKSLLEVVEYSKFISNLIEEEGLQDPTEIASLPRLLLNIETGIPSMYKSLQAIKGLDEMFGKANLLARIGDTFNEINKELDNQANNKAIDFTKIVDIINNLVKQNGLETKDILKDFINFYTISKRLLESNDKQSKRVTKQDLYEITNTVPEVETVMERFFPSIKSYYQWRAKTQAVNEVDKTMIDGFAINSLGELVNIPAIINSEYGIKEMYSGDNYIAEGKAKINEGFLNMNSSNVAGGHGTDYSQEDRRRNEDSTTGIAIESNKWGTLHQVKLTIRNNNTKEDNEIPISIYRDSKDSTPTVLSWGEAKTKYGHLANWIRENVPIEITSSKDGSHIGWVHGMEWTNGYNIGAGKEGDNVQIQQQLLQEFRKNIFDGGITYAEMNLNSTGFLNTSLVSKGTVLEMLPIGSSFPADLIGIIRDNNGTITAKTMNDEISLEDKHSLTGDKNSLGKLNGASVIMLPSPGGYPIPIPVTMRTLQESDMVGVVKELIRTILDGSPEERETAYETLKKYVNIEFTSNAIKVDVLKYNESVSTISINKNRSALLVTKGSNQLLYSNTKGVTTEKYLEAITDALKQVRLSVSMDALNDTSSNTIKKLNEKGELVDINRPLSTFYMENMITNVIEKTYVHEKENNRAEVVYFNNTLRGVTLIHEKNNIEEGQEAKQKQVPRAQVLNTTNTRTLTPERQAARDKLKGKDQNKGTLNSVNLDNTNIIDLPIKQITDLTEIEGCNQQINIL